MAFSTFHERWVERLNHLAHQLKVAPKPTTPQQNQSLLQFIHKVISHFSEYYRVKSIAAHHDVLALIAAPWASSFERSLHWVAGWRPSTAFHLIYSQSSANFESRIFQILQGLRTGDLGDLSPDQMRRVSELQCQTVREENAITEELAEWEDGVLSEFSEGVDLKERIHRLVSVVVKADDLRSRTIERVVELLSPQQAVEFLVAVVELQLGIHGIGLNYHERQGKII